jgi:hypothetical protein
LRIPYDPNEPNGREKAIKRYYRGNILFYGSIGSICYYIWALFSFLNKKDYVNFLLSLGGMIVFATIDYFVFVSKKEKFSKIGTAIVFFPCFIMGTIEISGIVSIIVAIGQMCHKGTGVALLLGSFVAVVINTSVIVLLYKMIMSDKPLFKSITKETKQTLRKKNDSISYEKTAPLMNMSDMENPVIYCHMCGTKLPVDSDFCSSCGTKLYKQGD